MDILTVESDIVELVEDGALSWEAVARAGLRWISNYGGRRRIGLVSDSGPSSRWWVGASS